MKPRIDPVEIVEAELHDDECDLADGCRCGKSDLEYRRKVAERIVRAIHNAGLVVVELPEPDSYGSAEHESENDWPTWLSGSYARRPQFSQWIAHGDGVEDNNGDLHTDLDGLRRTGLVILAAAAACERFRAAR